MKTDWYILLAKFFPSSPPTACLQTWLGCGLGQHKTCLFSWTFCKIINEFYGKMWRYFVCRENRNYLRKLCLSHNSRAGMRGSLRGGQLKWLINTYLAQLHRKVQKNPVIYMDSVMRYSCTTFVLGIPSWQNILEYRFVFNEIYACETLWLTHTKSS